MDTTKKLFFSFFHLLLLLLSFLSGKEQQVLGHRPLYGFRPTKLFVFGDSYVDTGNFQKNVSGSWKQPYGITFPGKPAGRFSNGRVSTDYLARFIGIKSPIPYRLRKFGFKHLKNGMNFAYGGTGVFNTLVLEPNMTTQIDIFKQVVIKEAAYSPADLKSSMALVSVAGNDYSTYLSINNSTQGVQEFIPKVVNQLSLNLKRIHELGVKKIVVSSLPPVGCLPRSTSAMSFQQCDAAQNSLASFHNQLLQQAVAKLNNETKNSTFVIVDLNGAFMNTLMNNGSSKFENLLKPCCIGIGKDNSCGSVDANGVKMYTVCAKPESSFFWDGVHPTQEGWRSVYSTLKPNLQQIYK